jgi:putative redox protein
MTLPFGRQGGTDSSAFRRRIRFTTLLQLRNWPPSWDDGHVSWPTSPQKDQDRMSAHTHPDPSKLKPMTIKAVASARGAARTTATIRGFTLVFDEPHERGGTDEGPTPTEAFVSILCSVTTVLLHRLAENEGKSVVVHDVSAEATLDRRGIWLIEAVKTPWIRSHTIARITTDADDETLRRWAGLFAQHSPMHATLASSGTDVSVEIVRA